MNWVFAQSSSLDPLPYQFFFRLWNILLWNIINFINLVHRKKIEKLYYTHAKFNTMSLQRKYISWAVCCKISNFRISFWLCIMLTIFFCFCFIYCIIFLNMRGFKNVCENMYYLKKSAWFWTLWITLLWSSNHWWAILSLGFQDDLSCIIDFSLLEICLVRYVLLIVLK